MRMLFHTEYWFIQLNSFASENDLLCIFNGMKIGIDAVNSFTVQSCISFINQQQRREAMRRDPKSKTWHKEELRQFRNGPAKEKEICYE